jgi:hypothetical protein
VLPHALVQPSGAQDDGVVGEQNEDPAIHDAVTAGTEASRTRDSDPAAAAALDYGLSQRALIAVFGRRNDVAELITRRLAALAHSGLDALDEPTVRAVVRQAVRTAPPSPPADPPADPVLAALRASPSSMTSPPAPTRSNVRCGDRQRSAVR